MCKAFSKTPVIKTLLVEVHKVLLLYNLWHQWLQSTQFLSSNDSRTTQQWTRTSWTTACLSIVTNWLHTGLCSNKQHKWHFEEFEYGNVLPPTSQKTPLPLVHVPSLKRFKRGPSLELFSRVWEMSWSIIWFQNFLLKTNWCPILPKSQSTNNPDTPLIWVCRHSNLISNYRVWL